MVCFCPVSNADSDLPAIKAATAYPPSNSALCCFDHINPNIPGQFKTKPILKNTAINTVPEFLD